jgi:hypothetical protein
LHSSAVSWKSTKQNIIATSSTEAEYIASSEAAKEALWIRRLFAEIQGYSPRPTSIESYGNDIQSQLEALRITPRQPKASNDSLEPQVIFADNQGAIKLSKNPQHHNRSKHIDIKYHFVRDSCQRGLIELIYIPTAEMVADILTKALLHEKHEKHMKGMSLSQWGMH